MGQTASIASKTATFQLVTPLLVATIVRFTRPNAGRKTLLWASGSMLVAGYLMSTIINLLSQRQKCRKLNIPVALVAAVPGALLGALGFASAYIGWDVGKALITTQTFGVVGSEMVSAASVSPNTVFSGVILASILSYIGTFAGAAIAIKNTCK